MGATSISSPEHRRNFVTAILPKIKPAIFNRLPRREKLRAFDFFCCLRSSWSLYSSRFTTNFANRFPKFFCRRKCLSLFGYSDILITGLAHLALRESFSRRAFFSTPSDSSCRISSQSDSISYLCEALARIIPVFFAL